MWLFTTIGFYSIVEPHKQKGTMMVRARVKADLENLKAQVMPTLSEIIFTKYRDYPYRAFINKDEFSAGMAKLATMIDYDNFKSEVTSKQGWDRSSLYHRVWSVLHGLEVNKKRIESYFSGPPIRKARKNKKEKPVDEAQHMSRFHSIMDTMDDRTRSTGTKG